MISKVQLREAFNSLKNAIVDLKDYSIITCFHHHFYPFPEIYNKYGDSSLIRNFTNVIDKLQNNNVRVVLHGHKHIPIIRPVTNQKYFNDPNSMLYVFSAGSIGKKNVSHRSFQIIDLYNPNENRIAKLHRFNYKLEQLEKSETFLVPPQRKYEINDYIMLLDVLAEEYPDKFKKYITEIQEKDNISQNYRLDDILKNTSKSITSFESVKQNIQKNPDNILVLLLSIHYRIIMLHRLRKSSGNEGNIALHNIKTFFREIINNEEHENKLFTLLETNSNTDFERNYDKLEKEISHKNKIFTAYTTIAIFFTDLYLTLSSYGEFYYKNEKINYNVNIKLKENTFHENIPITTIKITSDVDRRSTIIQFKCTDSTVHKISVLMIKDFEKRINKIEDSLRILGLKMYYINTKVISKNYDLKNLNFEAYIPTLLPLLTGDHLYKQKEVFIRELLQNSLDAILLREKIDDNKFNKAINIVYGRKKNPKTGKLRKYLQIIDHGLGMDMFKIERYFTSIGRSFYVSDEFDELKKNEGIDYKPISNFGIDFLSAFMVCKEINVKTRHYGQNDGYEIHIPNFDGCFFINKLSEKDLDFGTTITLFEDERQLFKIRKILDYIKKTILDFQLNIEITNKISNNKKYYIKSNLIRRDKELILFMPFTEKGAKTISWKKDIISHKFIDKYNFGLLINFPEKIGEKSKTKCTYLNSGILLSDSSIDFFNYDYCEQYYNFPSSYLDIDVARENIIGFKEMSNGEKYLQKTTSLEILANQALDLIDYIKTEKTNLNIVTIDNIYKFFINNELSIAKLNLIRKHLFGISLILNSESSVSVRIKPLPNISLKPKVLFRLFLNVFKIYISAFESANLHDSKVHYEPNYQRALTIDAVRAKNLKHINTFESSRIEIMGDEFEEIRLLNKEINRIIQKTNLDKINTNKIIDLLMKKFDALYSSEVEKSLIKFQNYIFNHMFNISDSNKVYSFIHQKDYNERKHHGRPDLLISNTEIRRDFMIVDEKSTKLIGNSKYKKILYDLIMSSIDSGGFNFLDLTYCITKYYIWLSNELTIDQIKDFEVKI